MLITVHPDVKYVFIGIQPSTGNTPTFESFTLATNDPGVRVLTNRQGWVDYNGANLQMQRETPGGLISSHPPIRPIMARGKVVWNQNAASGATSQGWIQCINKNYTLTTAAQAGDDHVHLSSTSGISSGDIIAVDLDSGLQHYTTVNGAPSGDSVPLTAAIPAGAAAAIGNAAKTNVWKVLPNIGP
jgi:hypothetical protein